MSTLGMSTIKIRPMPKLNKTPTTLSMNSQAGACGTRQSGGGGDNLLRKGEDELDIAMLNGKDIAIIECKYKAHTKGINRLLTKKYINFQKLYPEYKNYQHHLRLASFYINDNVKQQATDHKTMLLQRKSDVIKLVS